MRPLASVIWDVVSSFLSLDDRLHTTLGLLYLHPGRLTLDYLGGRRVRYVRPFRLVFFLAVTTFLAVQVLVVHGPLLQAAGGPLVQFFSGMKSGLADPGDGSQVAGVPAQTEARAHGGDGLGRYSESIQLSLRDLDADNDARRQAAWQALVSNMLAAAPTVLLLMLPLFAVILKLFYLFQRRLYMEHLIVAMYSHGFILLTILLLLGVNLTAAWLVPHAPWLDWPLRLLGMALWAWMLAGILRMQKRVYAQGWPLTAFKYVGIGLCYCGLLAGGMLVVVLVGLAA